MNEIANQLVQSLFKKNSLQECSRWELEILAEHYPYFGIAQLLVSGKLKEENAEGYEKQLQKTSLYFTNPFWLDYVLNNKKLSSEETAIKEEEEIEPVNETITEDISKVDPQLVHEDNHTQQSQVADTTVERPDLQEVEIAKAPSINSPDESIIHEENHTQQSEVFETTVKHPGLQEEITEVPSITSPDETTIHEEDTVGEIKIAPLKMEPLNENAPLVFEAYHTVDYFASQGIKLSVDEKPQDRFGQQLKSFTQWLKTIKKVPAAETANEYGKAVEQKVLSLAEHSIEAREIVTEAMAEVWLKQGNKEKAVEVYNKLSLQNPAKSSYFASLIEQLNQH